ncbi:MAG: cytochrome c biogenesis protein CcsA [Acidobacteria bacterium]|nr:cytochrome c biogenesis protein CcsA [Acidobacteriota bacterium]
MRKVFDTLGSLKVAVSLLVLLLVGLAAGTILESARGPEVAGRVVYYAWWFLGMQALFLVNVTASIIGLFPWGKKRVGFLMTHGALLLILTGAAVSYFFKQEGQIGLWEGQRDNGIENVDRDGRLIGRLTLPFSVRLLDFRIDHYPGTMQPSGFRSEVEIIEPDGKTFRTAIWMNHELHHRGWRLFQSSYRQEAGREATILSASKDPGQQIVFAGYVMLVAGMCTVLGTRIAQSRAMTAIRAQVGSSGNRPGTAASLALLAALAGGTRAPAAGLDTESLRRLPVQHDGRVMPLDTLARETVWQVTGRRVWSQQDPVATMIAWTFDSHAAATAPIVEIGSSDLAVAIGLPAGTSRVSFMQLVSNPALMGLIQQAEKADAEGAPRQGLLAAAEKLRGRGLWLSQVLNREIIRPIPAQGDASAAWEVPAMRSAADLAALAGGRRLQGWPTSAAIDREVTYNAVRPTRIAWIVLSAALLFSILAWSRGSRILDGISLAGLIAGFGVMTWGIGTRWIIADRIPAANMFESLLFLAWGVGLFAAVAVAFMRNRLVVLNANAMAALTMALTDLLPIDGFIHPVAPVLAGTPWLAIHVPIIMVSYSVLALGVVVAHMQIGFTIFAPKRDDLILRMNDLLYWYMHVGSILLIAGILTGSIWAASSWGRYWGWDPKEVWSLVAFLAYVAILHARWDRMIGPFGVAAISILAFQTILMTYLGVNFVLTSGMHSYGFGDSPVVRWMIMVAAVEGVFLAWGLFADRRNHAAEVRPASPP